MIRKIVSAFLVCSLVFFGGPNERLTPKAEAAAVVAVAPVVAIGLLEILLGAVILAAAIGAISAAQKAQYSANINSDIAAINDATKRGIDATNRAITRGLTSLMRINGNLGTFAISCPTAVLVAAGVISAKTSGATTSSSSTQARNATAAGECDPSLRGSPFDCCPDFMKRFGTDEMSPVGRFAYKVEYWVRGGFQRRCCFEWDSMHGRFEVYERSNHDPFNHKGEKACARPEDMEDLCQATYPDKADLLSLRHSPRNGCP